MSVLLITFHPLLVCLSVNFSLLVHLLQNYWARFKKCDEQKSCGFLGNQPWKLAQYIFEWRKFKFVQMDGHVPFQGEITATINQPACIIIALIKLVFCYEIFLQWVMWPAGLLFFSLTAVCTCLQINCVGHDCLHFYLSFLLLNQLFTGSVELAQDKGGNIEIDMYCYVHIQSMNRNTKVTCIL